MLALMLRSIAARRERRRFHSPSALRCVSKHEAMPWPSSSFETRARWFLSCGISSERALLRMRTAELAARRRTVRGHSNLTMSNSPSRSRGACLRPGFATLLHSPRIEGWAERRETFGCSAKHPWGLHVTRQARRLARRLASHNAGRSPLSAPPWRFWAPGPRFSHRHLRRIGYSELLAPRS